MHPADWLTRKLDSGQPILYKPGAGKDEVLADWVFDIRSGLAGRTVDQIVEQLAASMAKQQGTTVDDKKVETGTDSRKVGVILSTQKDDAGATIKVRDTMYQIDANTLMSITETAPIAKWPQEAETLAKITASAVVGAK